VPRGRPVVAEKIAWTLMAARITAEVRRAGRLPAPPPCRDAQRPRKMVDRGAVSLCQRRLS